jgi:hypothetical protein
MSLSPSYTLQPFTQSDYLQSFFNGAVWGGFALAILGVLAWIVGVARFRTYGGLGLLSTRREPIRQHNNEEEIMYEHPHTH